MRLNLSNLLSTIVIVAFIITLSSSKSFGKISDKSAKAIAILRASKEERKARDIARKVKELRKKATIVRVRNLTTDNDITSHVVNIVEGQLNSLGFKVKPWPVTKAIVKGKKFTGFNSSEGLKVLGDYLDTNVLIFLTIEKCIVSTFAEELHEHVSSGNISIPANEFVEIQIKMSVFNVEDKKVAFSYKDRQFIPIITTTNNPKLQEVFHSALHQCINNLFITMQPVHSINPYEEAKKILEKEMTNNKS